MAGLLGAQTDLLAPAPVAEELQLAHPLVQCVLPGLQRGLPRPELLLSRLQRGLAFLERTSLSLEL